MSTKNSRRNPSVGNRTRTTANLSRSALENQSDMYSRSSSSVRRSAGRTKSSFRRTKKKPDPKIMMAAILTGVVMLVIFIVMIASSGKKKDKDKTASEESSVSVQTETSSADTEGENEDERVRSTQAVPIESQPQDAHSFGKADAEYLQNALFVGDQRTVGLCTSQYFKGVNYLAAANVTNADLAFLSVDMKEQGKHTLNEVLSSKNPKYIYIMSGINGIKNGPQQCINEMKSVIEVIRLCCPDSIIFLESNIKYSKAAEGDFVSMGTNANIENYNEMLKSLADGQQIFFLDIAKLFEKDYALATAASRDGANLVDEAYQAWADYIINNAYMANTSGASAPSTADNTLFMKDIDWSQYDENGLPIEEVVLSDEYENTEEEGDTDEDEWTDEDYDEDEYYDEDYEDEEYYEEDYEEDYDEDYDDDWEE